MGYIMNHCLDHSGIKKGMKELEKQNVAQWKCINQIKTWVIFGSGSMILCLVAIVIQLIIELIGN